jgi:hypothetical protein
LDSSDEQAAAIRRELDGRLQKVAEMEKVLSSRLFSHLLQGFLPRSAHPHGSDAPSMFPFAFYSPSSLEHFSHLSLAYATHTVYSAFWAIGIASTRVSCDARLFPSHRFLPSLFHLSPK